MQVKVYFLDTLFLAWRRPVVFAAMALTTSMLHTCVVLQTRASVLKATSTVAFSLSLSVAGIVTRISSTQPRFGKEALPLRALSMLSAFSGVSSICRAVLCARLLNRNCHPARAFGFFQDPRAGDHAMHSCPLSAQNEGLSDASCILACKPRLLAICRAAPCCLCHGKEMYLLRIVLP